MTPQEAEEAKVVSDMQKLGRFVDAQLPYGWGFVVLAFPYGEGGRLNYIANAERNDVVRAMYEFIEQTRESWGEQEPELSESALDTRLGRAMHESARLRALCTRAADALKSNQFDKYSPIGVALITELRKAAQ
jgi:hypothetical protein